MLITYLSSTGSRPFFEGFKTILPVENDSDCQNQTRPYNLQVHMEKGFSFSILPLFRQNRNYSESAQIKKKIHCLISQYPTGPNMSPIGQQKSS